LQVLQQPGTVVQNHNLITVTRPHCKTEVTSLKDNDRAKTVQ